ncbi:MAG: iron chelate uptake ABC transporter family permease subunit [Gammaproteobacteria bacterium]|nr:iron chelate uptake ABC transporter family permease subunit [Gammaproteobacteria bacterium]
MLEPFLMRALLAGIGVAIITGAIGCFVVWRRMAYFSDSLAHSTLLGVVLGLALGMNTNLTTMVISFMFAILLLILQQKKLLTTDTLLGILAHAALSIGIVLISLLNQTLDLHAYLFGDILTVTTTELWWIYLGGISVILLLIFNWSSLVLMTLNEDLARAEGVPVLLTHLLLLLIMSIVVAVSIRIVGILLITSMLIIPAASARQLAGSPEAMALIASLLGVLAVILGIYGSFQMDIPSGPSIVVAAVLLFVLLLPLSVLYKKITSYYFQK